MCISGEEKEKEKEMQNMLNCDTNHVERNFHNSFQILNLLFQSIQDTIKK